MLVELLAAAVKLLGASEGTAIETFQNNLFDQPINYLSHDLLFFTVYIESSVRGISNK